MAYSIDSKGKLTYQMFKLCNKDFEVGHYNINKPLSVMLSDYIEVNDIYKLLHLELLNHDYCDEICDEFIDSFIKDFFSGNQGYFIFDLLDEFNNVYEFNNSYIDYYDCLNCSDVKKVETRLNDEFLTLLDDFMDLIHSEYDDKHIICNRAFYRYYISVNGKKMLVSELNDDVELEKLNQKNLFLKKCYDYLAMNYPNIKFIDIDLNEVCDCQIKLSSNNYDDISLRKIYKELLRIVEGKYLISNVYDKNVKLIEEMVNLNESLINQECFNEYFYNENFSNYLIDFDGYHLLEENDNAYTIKSDKLLLKIALNSGLTFSINNHQLFNFDDYLINILDNSYTLNLTSKSNEVNYLLSNDDYQVKVTINSTNSVSFNFYYKNKICIKLVMVDKFFKAINLYENELLKIECQFYQHFEMKKIKSLINYFSEHSIYYYLDGSIRKTIELDDDNRVCMKYRDNVLYEKILYEKDVKKYRTIYRDGEVFMKIQYQDNIPVSKRINYYQIKYVYSRSYKTDYDLVLKK